MLLKGYEVTIVTCTKTGQTDFPSTYKGINIIWVHAPYSNNLSFKRRIYVFLKYIIFSSWQVITKRYDLIYATSTPLTIGIPAIIGNIFRRKKFYFEVRDVWPEIPQAMGIIQNKLIFYSLKKLASVCYNRSELVIALSKDMKNEILLNYPRVNENKILVAENGSKKIYFEGKKKNNLKNYKLIKDSKIVIYPGAFGHVNDVNYIVNLAQYFDKEITFLLFGEGILKESVISKAKDNLTLNRNLFIHSALPKKEIFQLISESDMLISTVADIPKLEHNSANKFFDGLRAGKIILINYGGWQEEFLNHNQCGLRLSRNYKEAKCQLTELIENESRFKKMQQNSIEHSYGFEVENITNKILEKIEYYD